MDAIDWASIVVKLLVLIGGYALGIYGGVIWHESGHAVAALILTRLPVEVEIGRDRRALSWRCSRLLLRLGWRGWRYGFTRYDRNLVSRGRQAAVAAAGPLATATLCGLLWSALSERPSGGWIWVLTLAFLVANVRILVSSLWPVPYRPDGAGGEIWLSDALDLWRLSRGGGKEREHRH